MFENYSLNCYKIKRMSISFNCFSEYICSRLNGELRWHWNSVYVTMTTKPSNIKDAFTRKYSIWPWRWPWDQGHTNVAQYPLHHVTCALEELDVVTSNSLGGDAFTRKCIIWPLTLTLGSMSYELLASTPCGLWICKIEVATSNSLRGDAFTRKDIIWPLTLTYGDPRSKQMVPSMDQLASKVEIPYFS